MIFTYEQEQEREREKYIHIIRKRILENIDDLRDKIKNNEDFPESKQNIDDLIEIDDYIENCLNKWYY